MTQRSICKRTSKTVLHRQFSTRLCAKHTFCKKKIYVLAESTYMTTHYKVIKLKISVFFLLFETVEALKKSNTNNRRVVQNFAL